MEEMPFPRTVGELRGDTLRAVAERRFEESDIFAALDDPATDPFARGVALGSLGLVKGDDTRVAALLRHVLAHPPGKPVEIWQRACIDGLVPRFGVQALPDLEWLWSQKIHRDVRDLLVEAFGHLGVTAHYDEAFALFERGLKGGRQTSGGIYMMTLAHYLFDCARNGVGTSNGIKALIRANWTRLPDKGGFAPLYSQMLPGIGSATVPLGEIPDPASWSRWRLMAARADRPTPPEVGAD